MPPKRPFLDLDSPRLGWIAALVVASLGTAFVQYEKIAKLQATIDGTPTLIQKRDREIDNLHTDIREIRLELKSCRGN